jgi:hypothetical protein
MLSVIGLLYPKSLFVPKQSSFRASPRAGNPGLVAFIFVCQEKAGNAGKLGEGRGSPGVERRVACWNCRKGTPTMHDASFEPQGDSSMPRQRPAALELPVGHPERGRVTLSSAESSEALQVQKGSALWIRRTRPAAAAPLSGEPRNRTHFINFGEPLRTQQKRGNQSMGPRAGVGCCLA